MEGGVNFALFSENATGVTLCLFDERGGETALPLTRRTAHVWHGFVRDVGPGQRYGYRVAGSFSPRDGHRFDPRKLLVDPYARALDGDVDYAALVGRADTAAGVPKGIVVESAPLPSSSRPHVPWNETVIYEAHVKGLTWLHPGVPEAIRGTYLGVAAPVMLDHYRSIGVTTIELMPVHESMTEVSVARRGLPNYWGYSTLAYLAPAQRFASKRGAQVTEFKTMVRTLHDAGFEVVLDVVYNHSCEGGEDGPTVSLRGIDNRSYYRLDPEDLSRYEDFTGCGNSLNVAHPQTLKLVMDSLRHWVEEMGVDGFRFDLAPTLARDAEHVDRLSAFFDIVHQDPTLADVKLIAEPWDLGSGGYQIGNFPVSWAEWNGRFRDTVRSFWTGDASKVPDLGYRLTGSSDLYQDDGRPPSASINFITAHDGFTLHDLVTYEGKHNEANGEENRDGGSDNHSWNCGVEGETSDLRTNVLRARQQRNLLATLFLSQGVPMILGGDEIGRTQRGNNNAYCQDGELSWTDWATSPSNAKLLGFVRELAILRRAHPIFRRRQFFQGGPVGRRGKKDITWLTPGGREMTPRDWSAPEIAAVATLLAGDGIDDVDDDGVPIVDDDFLVIYNASRLRLAFTLPEPADWQLVLDTSTAAGLGGKDPVRHRGVLRVPALTVLVLRARVP